MTKFNSHFKIGKKGKTLEEEKKENKKEEKKSGNKIKIILIVVAILIISLIVLGRIFSSFLINKLGSSFINRFLVRDGKVQITNDGKGITYSGEEGEFSFNSEGKLPEGFPSDFPLYPEAQITSSWNSASNDGQGSSLVLETTKTPEEVNSFYKKELEAKGWKVTNSFSSEETFTYTFEKGDLSGLVGIAPGEEGKTAISVTIGKN